jgi:hypothetical protein
MVFGAIKSFAQDKWDAGTGAIKSFASDTWDKAKAGAIKYGPALLDVGEAVSGALKDVVPFAGIAHSVIKGTRQVLQPKDSTSTSSTSSSTPLTPNKEANSILESAASPEKKIEIINNIAGTGGRGARGGKMMSFQQLKKQGRFDFGSIGSKYIPRETFRDEWHADGTRKISRK